MSDGSEGTTDRWKDANAVQFCAMDARARFEGAERRFDEFRNRARGLSTAAAAALAFELTLIGRILEVRPPYDVSPDTWVFGLFLMACILYVLLTGAQVLLMIRLLQYGFGTRKLEGLATPVQMLKALRDCDSVDAYAAIGNAYANAATDWDKANRELGPAIAQEGQRLGETMWLVVLVIVLLFVIVLVRFAPGTA